MAKKDDGLVTILHEFAGKISQPIILAVITAIFYIFSYVYFRAYQGERSIPFVDFPFEFFLIAGYVLLRKVVEVAICGLAIISFCKFRENFRNKATKPTLFEEFFNGFFNSYPIFAYLVFLYFLWSPSYESVGYTILSFFTFCIILLIKFDYSYNKFRNHPTWISYVVPLSYILLIGSMLIFLFVLPDVWGYNAAISEMKGRTNYYPETD